MHTSRNCPCWPKTHHMLRVGVADDSLLEGDAQLGVLPLQQLDVVPHLCGARFLVLLSAWCENG